jgi:hypothetical protein
MLLGSRPLRRRDVRSGATVGGREKNGEGGRLDRGILVIFAGGVHMSGELTVENGWSWDGMV